VAYLDEKNKYADAEKKFLEVANQYARTRPGQIARILCGPIRSTLKKFCDAEKNLKSGVQRRRFAHGAARFQLAWVYSQINQGRKPLSYTSNCGQTHNLCAQASGTPDAGGLLPQDRSPRKLQKLYNQVKQDFPLILPPPKKPYEGLELLNAKN